MTSISVVNTESDMNIRRIDRYDGQTIFGEDGSAIYELGNYLGGGASGSVYQAVDCLTETVINNDNEEERSVAVKILNPVGLKNLPFSQIQKCIPAWKGSPLNREQISGKSPMLKLVSSADNCESVTPYFLYIRSYFEYISDAISFLLI